MGIARGRVAPLCLFSSLSFLSPSYELYVVHHLRLHLRLPLIQKLEKRVSLSLSLSLSLCLCLCLSLSLCVSLSLSLLFSSSYYRRSLSHGRPRLSGLALRSMTTRRSPSSFTTTLHFASMISPHSSGA